MRCALLDADKLSHFLVTDLSISCTRRVVLYNHGHNNELLTRSGGFNPINNRGMEENRVRVRLKFQDPDILESQQIKQGLAQSWYLVLLEDVHTIADVAFDIRHAFHLEDSCPNGLTLEVDGFVLPASQPARLLKDYDLIRIYKVRRTDNVGQNSHEARNDHIPNKEWLASGLHGVELRALDEFEKETGGYESDQEEGEMETDISLDGGQRALKETKPSPSHKKEKVRGGKEYQRTNNVVSEVGKLRRSKVAEARQELATVQVKDKSNSALNCGVPKIRGVKCHALDELDKENGNDKEEENGAHKAFLGGGKKKSQAASENIHRKQERSGKKRKKKEVDIEEQGQVTQKGEKGPSSNGVPGTAEHDERKVKRKKSSHSGSHPVGADVESRETAEILQGKLVEADCEDGQEEGPSRKKKKRRDIKSLNEDSDARAGLLKEETAVDKVGEKKRKKETNLEFPAEKLRTRAVNGNEGSIPARAPKNKVNGESTPAKTTKNETNTQIQDQRPSRSARRKKAKRQWLREQAKLQTAQSAGVETYVSESNGSQFQFLGKLDSLPVVEEVIEVEAEEEVLPIVVRAGHIRFEPSGKDETSHQVGPSMSAILLGDQVKTKRQGQNWGQERSAEKHKSKGWATETTSSQSFEDTRDNKRNEHQIDPSSFEKHPALDGTPQEGDVLAYRLVELTTSWTPEISPYRVGIVVHWKHATNMIKVDPHPDYPCLLMNDSLEGEEEFAQGMEIDGPYDENGVLEIEFSSLVEVRLMKRVHLKNQDVLLSQSVEIEKGSPTAGGHPVDNSISEPKADVGNSAPTGEQQGQEDRSRTESSAWQALVSEELERKKTELCQRDVEITNASTVTMAPSEQPENANAGIEGGIVLTQAKTVRSRKHKFLKSAGVGSIVALLRAQQAL